MMRSQLISLNANGFCRSQRGAAAVEFAIVASLLFTVLLGIAEMGRLLWAWNAAAEATRLGARLAVVCSLNEANVSVRMRERLPYLAAGNVSIQYLPGGCTSANCTDVRVRLTGYTHQTIIPFVPLSVTLPSFQTTLPREYMESSGNPICS
jgi:Flp pilus assembly pilin Flp